MKIRKAPRGQEIAPGPSQKVNGCIDGLIGKIWNLMTQK